MIQTDSKIGLPLQIGAAGISLAAYVWLGYFASREDPPLLIGIFTLLFALYFLVVRAKLFDGKIAQGLGIALVFRAALIISTPNISDDFYRYIWDGVLFTNGVNPYSVLPSALINSTPAIPGITASLFHHLNSPEYYSVYPPICQYIFALSAKIGSGSLLPSVIAIRCVVLAAEAGSMCLLYRLALDLKKPPQLIYLYVFNPLVIVELTGNLHLEAIMVFFLILALYLLNTKRPVPSAIIMSLAVSTKLIPLIFLPLIVRKLGLKSGLKYCAITGIGLAILFLPFANLPSLWHFFTGLDLYFQQFEFNAGIYYLARALGYYIAGHNMIGIIGPMLSLIALAIILVLALRYRPDTTKLPIQAMLLSLTAYLMLATTVHPWYLTTLVMLSVFSGYTYPLVWAFLATLSYSAYQTAAYTENLWLIGAEYVIVILFLAMEVTRMKRSKGQANA